MKYLFAFALINFDSTVAQNPSVSTNFDMLQSFAASDASDEVDLTKDWADGELCTGLFDGAVPELETVSVGRYDTDELPLESIKEQCNDWCGLRSDSNCCFYWANDDEGQAFTGEVG